MSEKKILVVFGATGNQGGSVINSILKDPKTANEFKIRGITRDPSKPNAKALEAKGVECVAGDINDKVSIKHAFHGAYAVFAMTNYWEKMDAELEYNQGKSIADLAKVDLLTCPRHAGNSYFDMPSGKRCPAPNMVLSSKHQQTQQRQIPQRRALRLQSQRRTIHPRPEHPRHILPPRLLHVQHPRPNAPSHSPRKPLDPRHARPRGYPRPSIRRS